MRTVKRGGRSQPPRSESHADSSPNRSVRSRRASEGQQRLGEHISYPCPLCRGRGSADYKLGRDGYPRWLINCWSPSCLKRGAYLAALGGAWGLGAGATPEQLAVAAREYGRQSRRAEPKPLPTLDEIERWNHLLLRAREPMRYLIQERGLSLRVVRSARIGWDGDRLIFPMFHHGELVAAKWRLAEPGAQMRSWAGNGRPWPLYPDPDYNWSWVLLLAGELDALRARTVRLPACSVTCGAGHWRYEWTADLMGRKVVVCFDNNEVRQAVDRVEALLDAGIMARRLDVRGLGLTDPKGDLSDYLNSGGSARELRAALQSRRIVWRSVK